MGRSRSRHHLQSWHQGLSNFCGLFLQFMGNWQAQRYQSILMCPKAEESLWRNSIPDVVISDNGPQFTSSEFAQFGREWGFEHRTSSPGHQQANGQAESAVKTAKSTLRKARKSKSDPYVTILAARKTPTEYMDSSPVQRLLRRCTKTQLPITTELLKPQHVNTEDINKQIKTCQQKQVHYYNRKARDLPPLQELDERSYLVMTEDASYRRNEWIFERQKKGVNQIPVASKDVKATQEMAFRNPNPCSSRPWCHRRTTTNLVPLKWQLHHHVARNRSWDALTNQSVRHPCHCRLKPHLGELSTSQHTWRTI